MSKSTQVFYNGQPVSTGNPLPVRLTGSPGASAFIDLTDVPSSYVGASLQTVRVNAGETGLEFATVDGGSGLTQPQIMARISIGF